MYKDINDGDVGISAIPSQIRKAIINSGACISSPREGIGVPLSHPLVSLVFNRALRHVRLYGCQNNVKHAKNGESQAHNRVWSVFNWSGKIDLF